MNIGKVLLVAGMLVPLSSASSANLGAEDSWLVGFWHQTQDEDGTPSDVMEFRADGTYLNYGFHCRPPSTSPFHVFTGDIYVTPQVPGKGPIAIVFHPGENRQSLTFTSPRTRNNATYERLAANPCAS